MRSALPRVCAQTVSTALESGPVCSNYKIHGKDRYAHEPIVHAAVVTSRFLFFNTGFLNDARHAKL